MSYHFTDAPSESEPTALPDVKVFEAPNATRCDECSALDLGGEGQGHGFLCSNSEGPWEHAGGWYYAFGFPGYLPDSYPVGPFDTEAEALQNARENAGF